MTTHVSAAGRFQMGLLTLWMAIPGIIPPLGERGATLAPSDALGALTLGYVALRVFTGRFVASPAHVALLVHLGVVLASCLAFWGGGDFLLTSLGRAMRFVFICSPAFLLMLGGVNEHQFRSLVRIYLISCTIGVTLPLLAFALGSEAARATQTIDLVDVGVMNRAGGWVGDSSAFGHQISSLCTILIAAVAANLFRFRLTQALPVVVIAYGLYATSSRSALLAIAVPVALCTMIKAPLVKKLKIGAVLVLLALLASAGMGAASSLGITGGLETVIERLLEPFGLLFDSSRASMVSSGRLDNWASFHDRIGWQWLLGAGFGALPALYGIADNVLVKALGETGIMGLASLLLFIFFLVSRLWRTRAQQIAVFGLIVISGQIVNALLVDTLTFYSSMPSVIAIVACAYRYARDLRSARPEVDNIAKSSFA